MSDRRDDALSWDGDDDPTLDAGRAPVAPPTADDDAEVGGAVELPEGFQAVGKGAATVAGPTTAVDASADAGDAPGAAPLGNVALITLGVLGGVYLLWTLGWIVGGLRLQGTAEFLVAPVAYQVALWLAVLAPPLWFATVFVLTRGAKTWLRVVWLLAGVVLLVPWPFVMIGTVGQ
ncbi:DNA polymerase III subunit gamma/tau [Microbacterium sp. Root61]|uniref:hypothetical protein n=1 Tax=Microbacterium sp. Root61 TaxID=1736570 RepID=UPI0006F887A1|nr:hypothetical protein [Microbacterium sp. Root61]KRA23650.1 DNA polymerase III subunit gamma/tau [Microbacterium sp. Root61]